LDLLCYAIEIWWSNVWQNWPKEMHVFCFKICLENLHDHLNWKKGKSEGKNVIDTCSSQCLLYMQQQEAVWNVSNYSYKLMAASGCIVHKWSDFPPLGHGWVLVSSLVWNFIRSVVNRAKLVTSILFLFCKICGQQVFTITHMSHSKISSGEL